MFLFVHRYLWTVMFTFHLNVHVCMRVYLRKRFFCTSLCHSNADIKPTGQDGAHFLVGNVNAVNSEEIVMSHVWNKTCNLISTEFATRSGSVHKSKNEKMFTTEFLLFLFRFCLNAFPYTLSSESSKTFTKSRFLFFCLFCATNNKCRLSKFCLQ